MSIDRKDIASIRQDYIKGKLDEEDTHQNPISQFEKWFAEAQASSVNEPTAMVLSTVGSGGAPSSRVVLLKDIKSSGFTFFTNYLSRKGEEIGDNNNISLLFFWPELQRQVRIEGVAEKVSEEESTAYFLSRPKGSQISAIASPQSQVVANRQELEGRVAQLEYIFSANDSTERPVHWGGYLVKPTRIEFWQGRASRLHDRIVYERQDDIWTKQRLAP